MDFSSNESLRTFQDLFPALWQWLLNGNDYLAFQLPDGSYRPSRKYGLLTRPDFVSTVVEGRRTIGFYALGPQGATRFGAADFDADPEADGYFAARLFEQWTTTDWPTILEASSPGRWHVWRLWPDFVPAVEVRREIQSALVQVHPRAGVEIFPKQDQATGKGYGNLIRFPGKHQARGTFSQLVAVRNLEQVPRGKGWPEPTAGDRFEALYRNVTHGLALPAPHTRYPAQVKLIGRLKARTVDEATARRVVGRWLIENDALIVDGRDRRRVWGQFDQAWQAMPEGCDPVRAERPAYDPFWQEVRASLKDERARQLLDLVLAYPPSFFLSSYEVADALDIPQPSAWRLLARFQDWGLLRLVKRGKPLSQLKDGERPRANAFQRRGATAEERAFVRDHLRPR